MTTFKPRGQQQITTEYDNVDWLKSENDIQPKYDNKQHATQFNLPPSITSENKS